MNKTTTRTITVNINEPCDVEVEDNEGFIYDQLLPCMRFAIEGLEGMIEVGKEDAIDNADFTLEELIGDERELMGKLREVIDWFEGRDTTVRETY